MDVRQCPKCQATWFDGVLRWSTGRPGTNEDLDGLVCSRFGDERCINPARGTKHDGDTWEKRLDDLKRYEDQADR